MTIQSTPSKAWNWRDKTNPMWHTVSDEFLPVALRWKERGHALALDLGCGLGRHALFLADLGLHVTAVDLSEEGIGYLRDRIRERGLEHRVHTLLGDNVQLDLDTDSFDCVVAFHAIYHTDYLGLGRVMASIRRVLRPGGSVYLTFNSKANAAYRKSTNVVIDAHSIVKTEGPEEGIPHVFVDDADILHLMSGFQVEKKQHIGDYYDEQEVSWHYHIQATSLK